MASMQRTPAACSSWIGAVPVALASITNESDRHLKESAPSERNASTARASWSLTAALTRKARD
jgi:hypothetical protein